MHVRQALFLGGIGGHHHHARSRQARRGTHRFHALGFAFFGLCVLFRHFESGIGHGDLFAGFVARTALLRLRRLHFRNHFFFGLAFGQDDGGALGALGLRHHAQFLDSLFLLSHRAVHHDAFANHVGNGFLLHFQCPLFVDLLQRDFLLAIHHFQIACTDHFFFFNGHRALAVVLGHFLFAHRIFVLYRHLLLALQACHFGFGAFLGLDLGSLCLFAGAHGGHLTLLAGLCVGGLAVQLQHGFLGFHVFLLDLHLFVAAQLIGAHAFHRRQLGDFLDALGVQNIAGVQLGHRRLLQVINGGIFKHITRQVVTNLANDLVTEMVTRLVQVDELHGLAHRLQGLRELGREQVFQGVLVGGTLAAHALGDF